MEQIKCRELGFRCVNWGFEQLRDPVYPKPRLGWFFKDHLVACATAHDSQWSFLIWNLGAQWPQPLQAPLGRPQEDHFLSYFVWEVKGEMIKCVRCTWKEKDKGAFSEGGPE